jgi:hypothetical protein
MLTIYYALGINLVNLRLYTDLFYDKEEALNCAWKLAEQLTLSNPKDFITNPEPVGDVAVSRSWIFANSSVAYVVVEEWEVKVPNTGIAEPMQVGGLEDPRLDGLQGLMNLLNIPLNLPNISMLDFLDAKNNVPTVVPPVDDPFEDSLPCTFAYGTNWHRKKPLTVADVKADPHNALYPYDLSEQERLALVTARIRKRPNFSTKIDPFSSIVINQKETLAELKARTTLAQEVVNNECVLIENFIDSLIGEESSSSSEEEEQE